MEKLKWEFQAKMETVRKERSAIEEPVSYTHLDVYKRQDMFFRQEIMRVANGHFPYMEDFIIV